MVNVGPLAAEIVSLVWGTPANFDGFRVLAVLLHIQTAALNRGRQLYSAGRPSHWASAHISSFFMAALCNRGPLYFCLVISFYLSIFFYLSFFSSPNLSGHRLDVEICNVCARKAIIKAAKRIFNSDNICRSYCDFYFGVTFLEHSVYWRVV